MLAAKRSIGSLTLPVVAVLLIGAYVLAGTGLLALERRVALLASVALGVLGVVGSLAFGDLLSRGRENFAARVGATFGVVAFSIWVVVAMIQRGTPVLWRNHISSDLAATLPGGAATVRQLYLGVSSIQATMDVAFDLFYCLAIIVFSTVMLRDERFGRLLGGYGLAVAGGLLLLNLWTFPLPPSEAGLWDLGPLTAVWWVVAIVRAIKTERTRVPAADAAPV